MQKVEELAAALQAAVTQEFSKRKKALAATHQDYVTRVSSEDMALSLQTGVLLQILCSVLHPRSVLDVGSGFSSFVLRQERARRDNGLRVLSLDTDADWLERSRAYVREQGLDDDSFALWDAAQEEPFDLVLFDVERPPQRNAFLMPMLRKFCRPGTAVLLDDLHMSGFRVFALETLLGFSYGHVDCRSYTMDRFGRYASLFLLAS